MVSPPFFIEKGHSMKKILTALALFASPVYAQQEPDLTPVARSVQITLPCEHVVTVFDMLKSTGDRLQFLGNTIVNSSLTGQYYPAGLYVWMNLDNKTAQITLMFPNSKNTMCLLAAVKDFNPWGDSQPWEPPKDNKQSY